MTTTPRTWIAALAVAVAIGAAPRARADGTNEVRAVTFDESNGVTRVHVRGAETPTFTVYKLERPTRVVVDLPRARLAEALRGHESAAVLTASTWAVSTIAAQQLDEDAVRVIVTLARPGRYDVKTVGDELVVMVMPRDPAPKTARPEELARAQAESAQARQQAAQSKAEADAAKAAAAQAQQEAIRLRQAAADQAARAEAAQRAADDARRAQQQAAGTDAEALARAKATAEKAQNDAARAKAQAAQASEAASKAQADADRLRAAADDEKRAAEAMAAQARDAMTRAQAMQAQAKDELARAQATSQQAHDELTRAQATQQEAKGELARAQAAQQQAHDEMTRAQAEAETARQDADRAKRDAEAKRAEAEAAQRDAAKQTAQNRAETEQARQALARAQADAEAARQEAERAKQEAEARAAEAEAARRDADSKRGEVEAAKREMAALSEHSRGEIDAAKAEAAQVRAEAEREKADAARARREAEKMMKDARAQLAAIEHKAAEAQQLEDRARASNAAAQAREEAARDEAARAVHDREVAEAAAKQAQDARTRADASDRAQLDAQARDAEARLAAANQATADAEARRAAAEQAAQAARHQLEQTKTALATVEQQRAATEASATDAARKRSEAEAAVKDAVRRRTEAERAARIAEAAKTDAEHQREVAEAARADAERQRKIAETSARAALDAQHQAEASLAELTQRRSAAERAASELEARTRAEAKAQAEVAAAKARQASESEVAAARVEVAKLAAERRRAEAELADRRKAVAAQQAEAARLETVAAQAKDAADREEARRATLIAQDAEIRHPAPGVRQAPAVTAPSPVTLASAPVPPAARPKPEARSPKPALAKVQSINFRGGEDNGQVDLAISGAADVHLGEVTAEHVELIVDHAQLAAKLERTLDVSRFGSPIRRVSSFRDRRVPGRVRLIAELSQLATSTIDRDASGVRWRFAATEHEEPSAPAAPPPVIGGFASSTPITQESVSQVPPPSYPRRRIYHGATVDFDFKDAPIHDLLRIIAETGHVSIVVPDTIDAKVTVKLTHIPWDEALDVILASHGLWYRREGNVYRIAPRKELDAEDQDEAARRAAAVKAESPKPEVVTLNYASADELKGKLVGMLSPKGHLEVDGRTNALIINDVAGNREQIARLALQLDTQTPQITIEARIVEANSTFVREIGIQWGGNALAGAQGGNATGLLFPSSIAIAGGNEDAQTKRGGVALPSDFAVNVPAATGSGEGGALGISLGSVAGNLNINLRLSALEDAGTVRIISAPKITVLNNKQAEIRQGVSIPISVVSAAGTQTQFVQADLALKVTPYVSQRDCAIAMNLEVTKNEPDFVNVGARGDPTILRKEAKTTMLVNDGETAVLGGIYTRNSGLAYKKIPFFGDLPFIGWLFKDRRENDDRTEVLVFITPRITNKALLRCTQ